MKTLLFISALIAVSGMRTEVLSHGLSVSRAKTGHDAPGTASM